MAEGLPTGSFALSDLPKAPQFPGNLGQIQSVDPDKVYADVAKGLAQSNALAANYQRQGADLAQLGEQQSTANTNAALLAGLAQAKQAQNAADTQRAVLAQRVQPAVAGEQVAAANTGAAQQQAAATLIPGTTQLAATTNAGQQTIATNQNQLAQQGYSALKDFPQKLQAIAQTADEHGNPDYAKQYQLYSELQAQNPWLNHSAFAGENAFVNNERSQALGVLQARAKQAADLLRTQTVVGGRENVAQTQAGSRSDVAGINAAAREQSSNNPLVRAQQVYQGALDDLRSAQAGGDPQAIQDAQEAFNNAAEFRDVAERSSLRRTAIAGKGGVVNIGGNSFLGTPPPATTTASTPTTPLPGSPAANAAQATAATPTSFINPQTGERIQWNGTAWVPLQ